MRMTPRNGWMLSVALATQDDAPHHELPRLECVVGSAARALRTLEFVLSMPFGFRCSGVQSDRGVLRTLADQIDVQMRIYGTPPAWPGGLGEVWLDQWGRPFELDVPGPDGRAYDLIAVGSDGKRGSACGFWDEDDIVWSREDR
jgi:hypothetical protein